MRITTNGFYDRSSSAMTSLQDRADALQTQIATGKRLAAPSDDAVAYQRLAGLKRSTSDAKAYDANTTLAGSLLQQSDTTLAQITSGLQRASVLTVQAANDTLSPDARAAIGTELAGIVETLAGLANARDARGQAILGGIDGGAAVTRDANGGFVFAATPPSAIPIGDGQSVQPGETAARVFRFGDKDALSVIASLSATLIAGTTTGEEARGAIDDLATATQQATAIQASVGARAARVDMVAAQSSETTINREASRSAIEDTDVTQAITDLQKTMTILEATQASFSKLSKLSLFDYLR